MPRDHYYLPQRRLVSQEDASLIERADVPRSKFSGSWTHMTTFDAGYLVPFLVNEVLPGDHIRYDVTAYVRMATPLFPLFSNQRIDTFFFFVPNRLVWENWVRLMGEQDNPLGDTPDDFSVPQATTEPNEGFSLGSLADYFGLPTGPTPTAGWSVNALPFRAYYLIYNEWFRDQNLISKIMFPTGDGPDVDINTAALLKRAKSHDYFTTCLPWPQKFTSPNVPVGGLAPVLGLAIDTARVATAGDPGGRDSAGDLTTAWLGYYDASAAANLYVEATGAAAQGSPKIFADLTQATGVTINQLRESFLIQQLLERDARGGTRYTEKVFAHFGVRSPDMRLQRPEYIGGGSTPLITTPIAQTAPGDDPLGTLGGATTAAGQHKASYAATEHGYIIGLINVRSELAYQQGIARHWSRRTQYDFYVPSLAGLGEQAVLRKEIYAVGDDGTLDNVVFGYQEPWHELRTSYSHVSGYFRSTLTTPIDQWHLAQEFSSPPTLGQTFIEDTPPMARVLAAGAQADGQQYLADILIRREAVRPLPMFGTPVTLGRF